MSPLRATPKPYSPPPRFRRGKSLWLGFVGSLLARRFSRYRPAVCGEDLKKRDYRTSTQRIGVHFAERIRDTFRFLWIKKVS